MTLPFEVEPAGPPKPLRQGVAIDAAEMRRRIGVKFGKQSDGVALPQHLVMFEVPLDGERLREGAAGQWSQKVLRRLDAVAVGMWKSTGYLVHGFEIKVSRADLVVELRDPEKAAPGVAMCDRWWLALGGASLLREGDDLPDGWGVLAASGRGLRVLRKPAEREGVRDGRALAQLLASAMRVHGPCRSVGFWQGFARGQAAEKRDAEYRRIRDEHKAMVERMAAEREAS